MHKPYKGNKIITTKFTALNFIFKNLWIQFTKAANIYFLIILIMQCIPAISLTGGTRAQAMPLCTVVLISMIKDAFEDYKRYVNDKNENEDRKASCYDDDTKQFDQIQWQSIKVGNIIQIFQDEYAPADIVLLHSTGQNGRCFVETKNLDGETNLKPKQTNKDLQDIFDTEEKIT